MRFLKEDLDIDYRELETIKLHPQRNKLYIETIEDACNFLYSYGRKKGFRDNYAVFNNYDEETNGKYNDLIADFNNAESAIEYAKKIKDKPVRVEFQLRDSSNELIDWATIFEYNAEIEE